MFPAEIIHHNHCNNQNNNNHPIPTATRAAAAATTTSTRTTSNSYSYYNPDHHVSFHDGSNSPANDTNIITNATSMLFGTTLTTTTETATATATAITNAGNKYSSGTCTHRPPPPPRPTPPTPTRATFLSFHLRTLQQRWDDLREYFFGFMIMEEERYYSDDVDASDVYDHVASNYTRNTNYSNQYTVHAIEACTGPVAADVTDHGSVAGTGTSAMVQRSKSNVGNMHPTYCDDDDDDEGYDSDNDNRSIYDTNNSWYSYYYYNCCYYYPTIVIALSSFYLLQSMALMMIQCTVLPSVGYHLLLSSSSIAPSAAVTDRITSFVQQTISISIFGIAFGKLINGPIIDLMGVRRMLLCYTTLLVCLVLSLTFVRSDHNSTIATRKLATTIVHCIAFMIEFLSSIQWPCIVVVLATHFRHSRRQALVPTTTHHSNHPNHHQHRYHQNNHIFYENGIFLTSIASRIGSIIGIALSSHLVQLYGSDRYRIVAYLSVWMMSISISIIYLYIYDSNQSKYQPQNPIDINLYRKWFPKLTTTTTATATNRYRSWFDQYRYWTVNKVLRLLFHILQRNVIPSIRHVFGSVTFWIITCAHTGTSMVRSSQKLLPSYFVATSSSNRLGATVSPSTSSSIFLLSYEAATSYSMYHSTGTALGLLIGGTIYTRYCTNERQRKYFIFRLYLVSILSCYILCLLSITAVRTMLTQLFESDNSIRYIQIICIIVLNFGVAIQLYHIPSIVGASYGCDKGIFLSYNDGIAYLFVAFIWRYVVRYHTTTTTTVSTTAAYTSNDMNSTTTDGQGWAYGWAAVALSLILSGFLMMEFMEYYFCRPSSLLLLSSSSSSSSNTIAPATSTASNSNCNSRSTKGGTYETIIFV